MRITDLLALSYVPRWGIVPMLRDQTVADHSFRVVTIFTELAERVGIQLTAWDIMLVLQHDGPESHSGDIPAPFKRGIRDIVHIEEGKFCPWYTEPDARSLSSPRVYHLFHLSDLIEQYTWLLGWGHGPLAKRAGALIAQKLSQAMDDAEIPEPIIWTLISDINDEEGRFGGRAEASR